MNRVPTDNSQPAANRTASTKRSHLRRCWPVYVILVTWLILCHRLLLGLDVVAFRDSGNLYFPLFQAIDQVWAKGLVPLLNPHCDFGFPLVADGSSSVFYPGKLIFLLRFFSYPSRYGIYLSGHLLLAAFAAYGLARRFKCHRGGATIAALSYAFGAPVLFQVTNVIYLVSAAWLPIALLSVWNLLSTGKIRWSLVAAAVCAMMILGGDPQMTYHVGLICLASIVCGFGHQLFRASLGRTGPNSVQLRVWIGDRLAGLMILVIATFLLSAIQILPTARLAQRSERATATSAIEGQFQFSQPPWSLVETAVPNFSGKPFPINTHWQSKFAASDRIWFPSIYLGVITVVLAFSSVRFFRGNPRAIWLSWITLLFLLGSFGWYGGVWLIRELQIWCGLEAMGSSEKNPIGGVYWFLSNWFPLYASFRYPAKLMIVASLGVSILAGLSFQRLSQWRWKTFLAVALLIAIFGPILIEFGFRDVAQSLAKTPSSTKEILEFGPFDANVACRGMYLSLGQLVACLGAIGLLIGLRKAKKIRPTTWVACATFLVALDLLLANSWLLATVPRTAFEANVEVSQLEEFRLNRDNKQPFARFGQNGIPSSFLTSSSPDRLEQLILWDRTTLRAKHHLTDQQRILGSFHSIRLAEYAEVLEQIRATRLEQHFDPRISAGEIDWNRASFTIQSHPTADSNAEADKDQEGNSSYVLPLIGDAGWKVTATEIDGNRTIKLSSNQLSIFRGLQQVTVPTGNWNIRLSYEPIEFTIGLWLSSLSWLAVCVWVIALAFQRRTAKH